MEAAIDFLTTMHWGAVLQIIIIDILLGGDNAVVIALASLSVAHGEPNLALIMVAGALGAFTGDQIAYAIGVSQPLSLYVDTHGTGTVADEKLEAAITQVAAERLGGLTPRGIREGLGLNKPIYRKTAAYGHFGREDIDVPWEKTDKADLLRQEAGL